VDKRINAGGGLVEGIVDFVNEGFDDVSDECCTDEYADEDGDAYVHEAGADAVEAVCNAKEEQDEVGGCAKEDGDGEACDDVGEFW